MKRLAQLFWMDRSIKTKGLVVIALPVLILFIALFWAWQATLLEEAAEDDVQSALRIQAHLQALESVFDRAVLDVGSPLLVDGRAGRLDSAERAATRILAELETEIRDRQQRDHLRALKPAIAEAMAALRASDAAVAAAGLADPRAGGRQALTPGPLEHRLRGMRDHEAVLLSRRTSDAQRARARSRAVVVGAVAVGLLGSMAATLLLSFGIVRRVALLERDAQRLTRGEPLLRVAAGNDEIGRLGLALTDASVLLSQRQQRLEELVKRLFDIQEQERQRLAYQLHDGPAQVAVAALRHLEAFAGHHRPESAAARAALQRGIGLVQRTVHETRAAIAGLRPMALDDFGLSLALKIEADALREEGWRVTYVDELEGERLPAAVETALFRIAQEALVNVRKHAGAAAHVELTLRKLGRSTVLEVQDDGKGFDLRALEHAVRGRGERIGLEAMRERAALVGAAFCLDSVPGQGSRIRAEIPDARPSEPSMASR